MILNAYRVYFEKWQREELHDIGRARYESKDAETMSKTVNLTGSEPYMTHAFGAAPELAFEYLTGYSMDRESYAKGDDGRDFVIDGKTFEVKGSTFGGPEMQLKVPKAEYERKVPYCYVAARVSAGLFWVELLGIISRAKFGKDKTDKTYMRGGRNNWVVGLKNLSDIAVVIEPLYTELFFEYEEVV